MQINNRQEILLWVSGIIISIIAFYIFNRSETNWEMALIDEAQGKGLGLTRQAWFIGGNIDLTLMLLLKLVIPIR